MDKAAFFREARQDIPGPLAGIRVVEATTTWAGPMGACLLADLGAHDDEILQSLGLSTTGIKNLREEGVITRG